MTPEWTLARTDNEIARTNPPDERAASAPDSAARTFPMAPVAPDHTAGAATRKTGARDRRCSR